MLDLSEKGMAAWESRLPADVRSVLDYGTPPPPEELLERLRSAGEGVTSLVVSEPETAAVLGRARRLRLAAWLVSQADARGEAAAVVDLLTGEDEEGGGASEACLLFLEDLRMLNEVVSMRMAARVASPSALMAAAEVAVVLESEATYGNGGMSS